MFTIDQIISDVLIREGGFVDAIGEGDECRKFGITHTLLSEYYGRAAFKYEVETLSEEIARDIYERNYYIAPRINNLPRLIQAFSFDSAINYGTRHAIKLVQSVCNQAGYTPELSEDGTMGPNTRRGAEWAEGVMGTIFLRALIEERRNFYRIVVAAQPAQQALLPQWLERLNEFEQENQ
jgi:lysozyme family protein